MLGAAPRPCRLCDQLTELCDAHVLPNWVYRPSIELAGHAIKMTDHAPGVSQKIQTGEFDRDILCATCDNKPLGQYDRYAKTILRDYDWDQAIAQAEIPEGVVVPEYDYAALKLFFVSVAWRMSISNRPAFRRLTLGPCESRAKSMIKANDPGGVDDISVAVARFRGPAEFDQRLDPRRTVLSSWLTRIEGLRTFRLSLGEFSVLVKTDSRPFPDALRRVCLAPDQPLAVALRDFGRSPELRAMWELTNQDRRP